LVGSGSYPGVYYTSSTEGADSSPTYGVQHAGHQHSQHAAPGDSSSQFAEESWSSSSDTSGADEPPVPLHPNRTNCRPATSVSPSWENFPLSWQKGSLKIS
ncbi:hypothetical protein GOODEAATRI_033588, partial [Goodea atripinnis]